MQKKKISISRSRCFDGFANIREMYWNYSHRVHIPTERWPYIPKKLDKSSDEMALTFKEYEALTKLFFHYMFQMLLSGASYRSVSGLGEFRLVRKKVLPIKTTKKIQAKMLAEGKTIAEVNDFIAENPGVGNVDKRKVDLSGNKFRLKWETRGWNIRFAEMWNLRMTKKAWGFIFEYYKENPSDIYKIEEI